MKHPEKSVVDQSKRWVEYVVNYPLLRSIFFVGVLTNETSVVDQSKGRVWSNRW